MPLMEPDDGVVTESEEAALVARAVKGDRGAIEKIFVQYRDQVYSLALRLTGNPADAEDICQDVFVTAMRKLVTFEGRSALSTWFYRVTLNRCRDHMRKKKRSPQPSPDGNPVEEKVSVTPLTANPEAEPEESAITAETQAAVQKALLELPPKLRVPLVLHEIEGLEYREVARAMTLPVGTVKSRIFRARLKLGEILDPQKEQFM